MNTSSSSIRINSLRKSLPIALAIVTLAVVSTGAQAQTIDEITISAPSVKTIERDSATRAPIQQRTVTARVTFDPVTLTTNSGVALLKDSVLDAARKACYSADPLSQDDGTCVQTAVKAAKPQVTAAIAHARSSGNS